MIRQYMTAMALAAVASAGAVEPWSLDSCVNYAISHNITVQSRMLEAEGGRLSVTEAKDRFLPTVSGYGSQSFSFGRGLTAENTYANRNTSSFSAGAQLSLPIFQGLAGVRRLDYAKASLRALLEQTEAAKDDVTLNVTSQYLQALYTAEMIAVARARNARWYRAGTLTQRGHPHHPLYLRKDSPLETFDAARYLDTLASDNSSIHTTRHK